MERFFEGHKKHSEDLDPYAVSHLGWGLNPNSILDQVTLTGNQMDRIASHTRAWPGVFLFSTGPNDQGGGSNRTPAHLDLPMFDCTVAFDDKTVIKDGVIVDPQMVVAQTEERRIAG
jgi:2,5-dihydroxypyridine 5,6-dioxygenase